MMVEAGCVGRDRETENVLARGRDVEEMGFLVVTGPAGVGKSTMLAHLVALHRNREDAGVTLWAHATVWEQDVAGGVVGRLLRSHRDRDSDEAAPVDADPSVDAAEALAMLLGDDRPSLVVVDDADHADTVSLQTILSVAHSHRARRTLVVFGMSAPHPTLSGTPADEVRLAGLDASAVADLAAHRGIVLHPTTLDALTRHTRGVPRDIVALLDEMPSGVWSRADAQLPAPAYLVADVRARLEACPDRARALIESLAILDDAEPLSTAVAHAGTDAPLAAIDDARSSGLITVDAALTPAEAQPRPTSPLIRAAVLEVMGMQAVGDAHRRAAELVTDPARRLHHRVAATPTSDPDLADDLDRLARERGADGAWAEAAGLFRQAGRLTADPLVRDTRITLAVDALLAAGDCVGAGALVPLVESLRETPLRNATLAYLAILRGRSAEARVRLDRAWDIVNFDRDPDTAALIAQRYVLHDLVRCQGSELVDWADRAISMAGSASPAGVEAAVIRGLGLAWSGHPVEASAEYASLTERIRFGAQAQRATMGRGWLQLGLDDVGAARSNLETAVSMAKLGGSTRISLWALAWLARTQFLTGDWEPALHSVEQGRTLARSSGIALASPLLNWTAAAIHSLRGEWDEAELGVQQGATNVGDYEIMRIPELLARAQIAEAAADYEKVRRILEPLPRMAADVPALTEPGWWPWVDVLANALVIGGQLDAADALLRPYEALAADRGHRSAGARLKYARGRHLGATGDIHRARRTFEEALDLLDGLPLRYDRARVNFAYGQTLRRAGKRRAADAVIGAAREIYISLGATTYVERCDRELKAGGLNATRSDRDVVELTPQEEAVTALVSRGLSNREVAAELFISPKTVQYHLTRIYAKLGLRSRSELAASRR
ncbi:LuxR family transcriptional regulator [Gordonia sp. OPL2]|uniref:helix-turn-helix transcriptional regulator n=1 Tax=Gordonia sp. OPL2 TaxID=2486274 RepID=UPI0016559F1A|nr:LuxR family transcriptional regulator [Gordonia sp. OPL2]ROZ89400.1 helix-turn-helix transcriptional regulator [Gordonia sp. OPL2]